MITITLNFALPTLNEMLNVARRSKYASATQKKKYDRKVYHEIVTQLSVVPHYESIELDVIWIETPKKRDPDNVFICKSILDSIVKSGIIDDDDRDHVKKISNSIIIEKKRGVIINIIGS